MNDQTTPILLGREPEELTIKLPTGSKPGAYEIQFLKTADRPLFTVTGNATNETGAPILTARVDLSQYKAGRYFIGIRQVPWDWIYYPVLLG
jgi:hypothetical protein